ncbi:hypothetical protein [Flavobacterium sp.]|uniref:hypothetical protein n=1 Tax=Flavobacterium sp. TaxID=239 RepID=UPI0026298B85|nr:hypothetical protein [Flavobacterium sp.]
MKKLMLVAFLFFGSKALFAQGCSDAGICSIDKGFDTETDSVRHVIETAVVYSLGEADVKYVSPYVAYTKHFSSKFSFTARVTYSTATGSFGTRSQFGDAFLIGNYRFKPTKQKQWSALLGFKFPFTASNLKINGYSLPLDYQSSLGTIDVLAGTTLKTGSFDWQLAVQVPVVNLNRNSYFSEYSGTTDFPSTNLFERKPDALFRATYTWQTPSRKLSFRPNVLFIYHLGEDTYENIFSERVPIAGSDGLTVNLNGAASYRLTRKQQLEVSVAAPVVVRDVRPDGLTRSFVLGVSYQYSF